MQNKKNNARLNIIHQKHRTALSKNNRKKATQSPNKNIFEPTNNERKSKRTLHHIFNPIIIFQ